MDDLEAGSAPSIIDMPLACMDQLIASLGNDEALNMCMTCTAMKNHVLRQRPLRVVIPSDILHEYEAAFMQAKLLLTCKYSANLALVFSKTGQPSSACTVSTQRLLAASMGKLGHALTAVTRVHLMGLELPNVVPSWLSSACPNMRALQLTACALTASPASNASSVPALGCGQLREVALDGQTLRDENHWPAWQQQLCTLSGLTSLNISVSMPARFLSGCATLCARLTELKLQTMDDACMEILLSMPQLTRLECQSFNMRHNYSQRACNWACLLVGVLDVDSLDLLPLERIRSIQVCTFLVKPSPVLATCQRVAAVLVKHGNLAWGEVQGRLTILNFLSHADSSCMAALAPLLAQHTFTHVHLLDVDLGGILPAWLGAACPQMKKLELGNCRLVTPAAPTASPQQLQELIIDYETIKDQAHWPVWQRRMRAMPCLTSLSIHGLSMFSLLSGCPELLNQLTRLNLQSHLVEDEDMEVLLGMPRLTHLDCDGLELQERYSQRACQWQHIGFDTLDVDQLSLLPLDSMQCSVKAETIVPSTDLAACKKVASSIARAGGLRSQTVTFENANAADSACMAALMTALAPSRHASITLDAVHVTHEVVAAMGKAVGNHRVEELCFTDCTWVREVWSRLLPTLPPITRLSLHVVSGDEGFDDAVLIGLCMSACRPIEVQVTFGHYLYYEGLKEHARWEKQARKAMAAAGHQHVRLKVEYFKVSLDREAQEQEDEGWAGRDDWTSEEEEGGDDAWGEDETEEGEEEAT